MENTLIEQLVDIGEPSDQRRFVQAQTALLDPAVIRQMKAMADQAVRAETPRALRIAESALVVCGLMDDPSSLALSMRAKAQALHLMGQLEDALAAYDEASAIFARDANPVESARSLIGKIDVLLHVGRPYDALETADQCRATFLTHDEPLLEAKAALNQGNIFQRLDRYADALAVYRAARQVFQRHDEQLLVALADTNMGHTYSYTAQFRQAQRALRQASEVYRQRDLKTALAMNETNLGLLYGLQGRYNQALLTLTAARSIFQEVGIPRNVATVDLDTADIYSALNHSSRALDTYDSALDTFRELGFASDIAKGVFGKATVHVQMGDYQLAEAELAEARRYFDDENNQVYLGLVELHQAIMTQADNRHNEALEIVRESMKRFLSASLPVKTAYARLVEGTSLRALGQEDEAISDFNSALAVGESLRLPWLLFESHAALGRAYRESDPRRARAHLASAVEAVERTRRSLQPEELKAAFLEDKQDSYASLVSLCLDLGGDEDIEEAFRYVERSKSQALLDILAGHVEVDAESDSRIDPRIASRLQTLRQELNSYYSALDQRGMGDGQRGVVIDDAVLERIERDEKEFMELAAQAQLQSGQAASVLHSTAVEMSSVREHLGDTDTTLVEYYQIDNEILAFVIGQDGGTRVVRDLTTAAEVASAHRRLRFQLRKLSLGGQPDPRLEQGLLNGTILHLGELYRALIKPVESHLSQRVIIVPHGILHYIPFHALHDGEGYLIDHREVTYAPSASVLQFCLENDSSGVRRPLLVGVEDSVIPQAVEEAEAVAAMFPDSTLLTDKRATQAHIRQHIEGHDALHLASHGEFQAENPAFSRVKLQDEWLTLYDIYNLDLKDVSLVTLSACQTGVSSVLAGDELMGLTRGFFYAGAPSMVVSLWEVNDASTGVLMRRFYQELESGKRKGEALRRAMLSLREQRPHPYHWAPFILTGKPF